MKTLGTVLPAAVLVACLAACGGTDTSAPAGAPPAPGGVPAATGSLDAADQTTPGKFITIASVDLRAGGSGGWIALHADADGQPGPVSYVISVPAGLSNNVAISTPDGLTTGAYWPTLHVDDSVIGTYEFGMKPDADLPVKNGNDLVMKKIMVTVG
ncbi:MAG: DUF7282 domain-containing protein [Pseudonocardia sp.]